MTTTVAKEYHSSPWAACLAWASNWGALAVSLVLHLLAGSVLINAFSFGTQAQVPKTLKGQLVFAAMVPLAATPTAPTESAIVTKSYQRQTSGLNKAVTEPLLESTASEDRPQTAQGIPVTEAGQTDQGARPTASAQRFRWRGGRQAEDRDRMVQQSMRDGMSSNQLERLLSQLQGIPPDLRAGEPIACELSVAGLICNAQGFAEQAMIAQLGAQVYRGNPGFRPLWLKRDSLGSWSATAQQNQSP